MNSSLIPDLISISLASLSGIQFLSIGLVFIFLLSSTSLKRHFLITNLKNFTPQLVDFSFLSWFSFLKSSICRAAKSSGIPYSLIWSKTSLSGTHLFSVLIVGSLLEFLEEK